jgi:glyoxylase-like metal-dependent hydrolase (beta-lactamase superfamily II)
VAAFTLGSVTLTRVPYFDVSLGPEAIGFSPQQVVEVQWGVPDWATEEGSVLVGQAIWVIESDGRTVVVDPCGASDAFLRTGPEASAHEAAVVAAMASSGFPVDSVDTVVMSHLDGIGMVGSVDADGGWSPLFPTARVVVSERELAHIESTEAIGGRAAFRALAAQGVVDPVQCPREIVPHVTMEQTGGHSPGHCALRIADDAVLVGHLAINPVQISAGVMPSQHLEPRQAFTALSAELAWAAERDTLVIGSLWPDPGAGRVAGPPWVITPAV